MAKLYLVPTPIGNLDDITLRAVRVLREVDLILAEDTRTTSVLLHHLGIEKPLRSHHKFNEHTSVEPVVNRLKGGENIALISDAGTPGISDPGFMLVRECRRNDIEVETLPGPTALIPALVNSGLPCDRFVFEGFLPQKKGRATRIAEIAEETRTIIFYESPLRLVKTLQQLAQACGNDREASVSREISKIHDTTVTGTLQQLIEHFTMNIPRGEIVIVLSGKREKNARQPHRNKYRDNDDLNDA